MRRNNRARERVREREAKKLGRPSAEVAITYRSSEEADSRDDLISFSAGNISGARGRKKSGGADGNRER